MRLKAAIAMIGMLFLLTALAAGRAAGSEQPTPESYAPESFLSGTGTEAATAPGGPTLLTRWKFEIERHGRVIDAWEQTNLCTTEGLGAMMDDFFGESNSSTTPWHVMLFDNSITPVIGDTYTSNNMSETTRYTTDSQDGSTTERPRWDGVEGTGATVYTNSADPAAFYIGSSVTVQGAALVGGCATSGTSLDATSGCTLFSEAEFPAERVLLDGDTLYVTIQYELDSD